MPGAGAAKSGEGLQPRRGLQGLHSASRDLGRGRPVGAVSRARWAEPGQGQALSACADCVPAPPAACSGESRCRQPRGKRCRDPDVARAAVCGAPGLEPQKHSKLQPSPVTRGKSGPAFANEAINNVHFRALI